MDRFKEPTASDELAMCERCDRRAPLVDGLCGICRNEIDGDDGYAQQLDREGDARNRWDDE